jgi:hypothetical protein
MKSLMFYLLLFPAVCWGTTADDLHLDKACNKLNAGYRHHSLLGCVPASWMEFGEIKIDNQKFKSASRAVKYCSARDQYLLHDHIQNGMLTRTIYNGNSAQTIGPYGKYRVKAVDKMLFPLDWAFKDEMESPRGHFSCVNEADIKKFGRDIAVFERLENQKREKEKPTLGGHNYRAGIK